VLLAALDRSLARGRRAARVGALVGAPDDGRVKLFLVRAALAARRRKELLFAAGSYEPLIPIGARARYVFAFARRRGRDRALVAVPRLLFGLAGDQPPLGALWGDTALRIPPAFGSTRWRCALTGTLVRAERTRTGWTLPLARLFAGFPGALLLPMNAGRLRPPSAARSRGRGVASRSA
jgi:(1->4)-alpha-D-glucan 1-alpha-D-glucosylmutase